MKGCSPMSMVEKIAEKNITLELNGKTIEEIFRLLAGLIDAAPVRERIDFIVEKLVEREELGSTGIGYGVALPHMKCDFLTEICVSFGLSRKGIDFNAVDGRPVHFVFLVLAPAADEYQDAYLHTMAKITRLMRKEEVRGEIKDARTPEEVMDVFKKY